MLVRDDTPPWVIAALEDRGYIREGYIADIAVIDPERYTDRATFDEPKLLSVGVELVLIGGKPASADGQPTGLLAGVALRRGQPQ